MVDINFIHQEVKASEIKDKLRATYISIIQITAWIAICYFRSWSHCFLLLTASSRRSIVIRFNRCSLVVVRHTVAHQSRGHDVTQVRWRRVTAARERCDVAGVGSFVDDVSLRQRRSGRSDAAVDCDFEVADSDVAQPSHRSLRRPDVVQTSWVVHSRRQSPDSIDSSHDASVNGTSLSYLEYMYQFLHAYYIVKIKKKFWLLYPKTMNSTLILIHTLSHVSLTALPTANGV